MRIAVYCSSSPTIDPKFIDLSFELGAAIASAGADLVSGGGHIRMMRRRRSTASFKYRFNIIDPSG
jgi:predicted Rossmann-fold nucleotide-binding protein